jgi:uncharacterized protein YkwD
MEDRAMRAFSSSGNGLLCAALVALLAACGSNTTEAPAPADGNGADSFASLVDAHRATVGCGALVRHDGLAAVAQAHSVDMAQRGYFSHDTPEGESPFDRLADAGITYQAAGENIAYGTSDPREVLDLWLASPGHRANIENCGFTHQGVGLSAGYWTHLFATNPSP